MRLSPLLPLFGRLSFRRSPGLGHERQNVSWQPTLGLYPGTTDWGIAFSDHTSMKHVLRRGFTWHDLPGCSRSSSLPVPKCNVGLRSVLQQWRLWRSRSDVQHAVTHLLALLRCRGYHAFQQQLSPQVITDCDEHCDLFYPVQQHGQMLSSHATCNMPRQRSGYCLV